MMKDIQQEYQQLKKLYHDVLDESQSAYQEWEAKIERPEFKESAQNLLAYLALRRRDIRSIQEQLMSYGLSSLGRLEAKTLATLEATLASFEAIHQLPQTYHHPDRQEFLHEYYRLIKNTRACYGPKPDHHHTRIMVTLPAEAAEDIDLLQKLVDEGMNVARINCAHDNTEVWQGMIDNIQQVAKANELSIPILMDIAGPKIRTEWVFTPNKNPKVSRGDQICITRNFKDLPLDIEEAVKVVAGCSLPGIYQSLKINDPVLIDDGSIEGRVVAQTDQSFTLRVEKVKGGKTRLKAEKGLNFPNSNFEIGILDDKDRADLRFALDHADIIGISFVRTAKDIKEVQAFIEENRTSSADQVHLMAKIETVQAFENLGEIIMTAASKNPFSVMIARGDLAVESGYVRLAELQEEILWICEAASIPVVWGTEVLGSLISNGVPTRSEITDAARSAHAEVVMLNKGEHIVEAVALIDQILSKMEDHSYKKTPKLRQLDVARMMLPH